MSELPPFNFFGSHDSLDYDVMFFVTPEQLVKIDLMQRTCDGYDEALTIYLRDKGLPEKPVNANISVVEKGVIVATFKGTPDEVNNSIFRTYSLHQQIHPLQIQRNLERDTLLKVLRTYRVVLSYLSRTPHREKVKEALRGSLAQRIATLEQIDLADVTDIGKKGSMVDFCKVMAFQLGQTRSLLNGLQLYTKSEIAHCYPFLTDALYRNQGRETFSLSMLKWQLNKLHEDVKQTYPVGILESAYEPKK